MTPAARHRARTVPTPRRARPVADRLRGLLSLLVLLVLLAGVPAALVTLRGNPLPDTVLDSGALLGALTRPDDGALFLGALTALAWAAWVSFAVSVLVEVPAQVRGLPSPHLPTLGMQQRTASALVAGAALLFTLPLPTLSSPAWAADAGPTSAATPQAFSAPVVVPASADTASDPPATATAAPGTGTGTYTVRPGDSLWQIAQDRLGDGARYAEIATLNYDAPQPDGLTLTGEHWLRPGWALRLPADASPLVPPAAVTTVVVEPGDTLWQIAQDRLGDGGRYDEIAAASTAVQNDGHRLTDPDLIRPGWQLNLPGAPAVPATASRPIAPPPHTTSPAAQQPRPAVLSPPPSAAAERPAAVATPAPGRQPEPRTGKPAGTDRADSVSGVGDDSGDELRVRTAAGVGALLASGVLVLLGIRRARQQRRRRPGHRIPMPPADLAPAELDLRLVEDPAGVGRVDQALRTLSVLLGETGRSLPALRLVRLTPQQLELSLAEPVTLPAPFLASADPTLWTLDVDAPLLDCVEVPAPYPSLVTLGHDLDGAHVLIDLEHAGALAVEGDAVNSLAVLAGLAAELATSSWADDLQVTVVGCLPSLPAALGQDRVRYLPDLSTLLPALEQRAADVRESLHANGLPDLQHARLATPEPAVHGGNWTPEILLLAGPLDPDLRARLDAVLHDLPRAAVAAVTTAVAGPDDWRLQLSPAYPDRETSAVLEPFGLTLRPQLLTADDLAQLCELLAIADRPDCPAADTSGTDAELVADEPGLVDLGSQLAAPATAAPAKPETPSALPSQDSPAPSDPRHTDEAAAAHTRPPGQVDDDEDNAGAGAPYVQVLGPVNVIGALGTVESSKRRQLTEIAAFLALHPGSNHHGMSEAIWPGARELNNTRNTALSKLRAWLGGPDDNVSYVPRASDDGGYRLHPAVRTDWHRWQDLLAAGPAQASTTELAAALELVRGKPFAGASPRRYAWAEPDRQDMISAIVDAAHELARRALLEADATLARRAAADGLQADPGAELLWRDALKAEWLAGDRDGLNITADRLCAFAKEFGDDLEPETEALLNDLLSKPIRPVQNR